MRNMFPRIALTMGDPAGIGPEIAVRVAAMPEIRRIADITVYGCPDIISAAAAKFAEGADLKIERTGALRFDEVQPGKNDLKSGFEAYNAVIKATKDVLAGAMDAVVTAPVNKASINQAGIQFSGHTELIAGLCGTADFAMMQSSGRLRIAFATTHIPIKKVARELTCNRIVEVGRLLDAAVRQEGVSEPKLAAAALNPHAGENGFMGREEIETIIPALEKLRSEGVNIDGPFPPDTLFIRATLRRYDGILSMYHDQGHIPFKMLAFDRGVNSTLGLPIIRTSVDHGTAFEIAWKGVADTGSLEAAIRLAVKRVKNK